jgi:uncharacterized protein with ParB-like and HNH nuclease domain
MAYTQIKIKDAMNEIENQDYVLPAIQREFVWKEHQIGRLFDSLMQDYPISTFLFWEVNKDNIKKFQFYKFLKEYHKKNHTHNPEADGLSRKEKITAVLDGQQRLTALYIGLTGSYASKKRNLYPKRRLYLNLLERAKDPKDPSIKYDFRFLTDEEVENRKDGGHWFECSKILLYGEDKDKIYDYLEDNDLSDTAKLEKDAVKFARSTLNHFYGVIHEKEKISYFPEKSEELDKVLQIFIRTNNGGTKLSHSDLLLSIATAQWKNDKNARDLIHGFVDEINGINPGFEFNKDLVLKNCLVLAGGAVGFKVDNFNAENTKKIEDEWDKTSSALRTAVELVASFGYGAKNLTSANALIPISYFIYKNNYEGQILHHSSREDDRKAIKEWLARVLLKGVFGGNPDQVYPLMRDLIDKYPDRFPLKEIINKYKGDDKSILFNSDEIDNLLKLQYGKDRTYSALTLIYPTLHHGRKYHQDHIHPRSKFSDKDYMKTAGVSEDDAKKFYDTIANLQLLEGEENREKKDKPYKDWLEGKYPDKQERDLELRHHHIGLDQSLAFEDFLGFVEARKKTIKDLLIGKLGITDKEADSE